MLLLHYFKELFKDRQLMKSCVTLAIPIMLQTLVVSSVNLVDNLMVGKLGDVALSAVVSSNKYYAIIQFVVNAVIASCSIYLSQFNGAGNIEKMKETFRFSFICSYTLLILGFTLVIVFPSQLIGFIIDDPAVILEGTNYLKYACWSYLPMGISICIAGSMRVVGDSKSPMMVSIVGIITNAFLDYAMIFGKFGFPMMGVAGAALATVIARIVEACLYLVVLKRGEYPFKTKISELLKFKKSLAKDIIVKAIPLTINEFLWQFGMTVLMKAYSSRGTVINTAYSIQMTISEIFFILFSGMAVASTVLIGTPLGANRLEEAKGNGYKLICFSELLSIVFGAGMFLSSYIVPLIYTTVSNDAMSCAQDFLKTMGLLYWIYMFNVQCYFILRAGGDTKSTMFMDSGFMWAFNIPLVAVLCYFTDLSIILVYVIGQCTDLVKAFIAYRMVRKEKWVRNLAIENQ